MLFTSMEWDCLWPAVTNWPVIHPPVDIVCVWKAWWNDIDRWKPQNLEKKTCPSATIPTTNPTSTDPGANPGLRGKRPTNQVSHDTALPYMYLRTYNLFSGVGFHIRSTITVLPSIQYNLRWVLILFSNYAKANYLTYFSLIFYEEWC
jgi:hypothetical protein